jgi:hypothetical protein
MEWKISETNIGRKPHAKTQRRKDKSEYEAVPRGLIIVLVLVVVLVLDSVDPAYGTSNGMLSSVVGAKSL